MSGAAPLDASTLPEAMRACARLRPTLPVVFPDQGLHLTVGELSAYADRIASELVGQGVRPCELVGLLCGTGPQVLGGIVGVAAAGAATSVLPAPTAMRDVERLAERLVTLVDAGGIGHLLTDRANRPVAEHIRTRRPGVVVLDVPAWDAPAAPAPVLPPVAPEDVVVVQYTSGSTSTPKGVVLRHSTVLAGLRSIATTARLGPHDVFAHWVPHFHDLGLFGWLATMLSGAATHTFSPVSFIRRPAAFLRYVAEHGATITAGPNFGYDLMLDAADDDLVSALDLRRWRLAFNGAEPVSAATVAAFTQRFAPAGAGPSVMYPVYGMAEATLAVTFPRPGDPPVVVHVDRARLARTGRVTTVHPDAPHAMSVVSVGRPVAGIEVCLTGHGGAVLGDDALGEIRIRGAAVTDGYRDAKADSDAFADGWLRTGDLGFWRGGELYVTGRSKDMIVVNGQNYFAEDVEAVVRDIEGVEGRRCVAVPADDEHLVVIVETRRPGSAVADGLPARIREQIAVALDLTAVRVHVGGLGALPRTTSGKWQRGLVRAMVARGSA